MNNSTMRLRINNGIQIGLGLVVVVVCVASVRFFLTDTAVTDAEVTELKSVTKQNVLSTISALQNQLHTCSIFFLGIDNTVIKQPGYLKKTNLGNIILTYNYQIKTVLKTSIPDDTLDLIVHTRDKKYYITFDETLSETSPKILEALRQAKGGRRKSKRRSRCIRAR